MIHVEGLSRVFATGGGGETVAVDNLSFTVAAGEVYGLLGPNGAGKTTTLRMLLGLLRPSAGWATIEGYSSALHPEEVKRRVGLVSASAEYLGPHAGPLRDGVRSLQLAFREYSAVPDEPGAGPGEKYIG